MGVFFAQELANDVDNSVMKIIRLPNPVVMIFGSLAAFSIAGIIHPSFNPIGIMILLFIPVLIVELLYPQKELEEQFDLLTKQAEVEAVSGELIDEVPEEKIEKGE